MSDSSSAIIIHGGAGKFTDEHAELKLSVLRELLNQAWSSLSSGEDAFQILVSVLEGLERSEYFNAGYGSYPNQDGKVRLDVSLMKGDRSYASLVNIDKVKHPSPMLAKLMEDEKDFFRIWNEEHKAKLKEYSKEFLARVGIVETEEEAFAPFALKLAEGKEQGFETKGSGGLNDTVGCVIRDAEGKIFAGTSTGGIAYKKIGRIGDSPIPGHGLFADDEIGGLSATGHGESIIKSQISGYLLTELRYYQRKDPEVFLKEPTKLKSLLDRELAEYQKLTNTSCGLIIIPSLGEPVYGVCKERMTVAVRTDGGVEQVEVLDS